MINFQSMQSRFMAIGIALVVVGVVIRLVLGVPFAQAQLREQLGAQQMSIASYVARDIDHSIIARRALIGELAATLPPTLLGQSAQLAAWLRDRQRLTPLFNNGLLVLGADGGVLAGHPTPVGSGVAAFATSPWFKAALTATAPVMSKPQRGLGGEPVIIMAASVRDAGGRAQAVLAGVAVLNAPGFLDRLQESRPGAAGGFLLISPQDKLFVGSTDPAMVLTPTPAPGINPLHDRAMAGYRGNGLTVNAEGVEELASMASVPSTGWFVVARTPAAQAFESIYSMRSFMLSSSLLVIAALIGILLVVMPRVMRPLTEAARAIREMADGRRELAPLPVLREDEVGSLVRGFNHLVARLTDDEAALRASEARMQFLAHHDSLTGLCNRAMLGDRLEQALARAERDGGRFALLFCDLDCFKPINDEHGHRVGDLVLAEVAARLTAGRRQTDTVARLGGDEFVMLLSDLVDVRADAEQVARQCVAALREPYQIEGKTLALSVSIGVALHPGHSVSASQLMSQADIAMYRAKGAGKNGVAFFDEEAAA